MVSLFIIVRISSGYMELLIVTDKLFAGVVALGPDTSAALVVLGKLVFSIS